MHACQVVAIVRQKLPDVEIAQARDLSFLRQD
jgi:hypothetical protein